MLGIQQSCRAGIMRTGHRGTLIQIQFVIATGGNRAVRDCGENFHARSRDIWFQEVKSVIGTAGAEIRHDIAIIIIEVIPNR